MAHARMLHLAHGETELGMQHYFVNMECGTEMRNCEKNRQRSKSLEEEAALEAAMPL